MMKMSCVGIASTELRHSQLTYVLCVCKCEHVCIYEATKSAVTSSVIRAPYPRESIQFHTGCVYSCSNKIYS